MASFAFNCVTRRSAGGLPPARQNICVYNRCLLLEAGPDYREFDNLPDSIRQGNNTWLSSYGPDAHTWGYLANATPGREPFILPRGKVMGGSSAINGQVFFRGAPDDFDEWAELGIRVVDASVMPDVLRANTNATTIMVAERVADWINGGAN